MSDMADSFRDDPMDEYAPIEEDDTPMVDFDLELGATVSEEAEDRVIRLAGEIKALDTWVGTVSAQMPETMYKAWKVWANGTLDGFNTILKKSAAEGVFPWVPGAGTVAAKITPGTVSNITPTFVAGIEEQLYAFRLTFKNAGLPVPGLPAGVVATPSVVTVMVPQPTPTPDPAAKPKPAGDEWMDKLLKGALIVGGGVIAVLLISSMLDKGKAQPAQAQEG